MKLILSISLILTGLLASAQITVNDYTIKLRADINALDQIEPVTASSTCGPVEVVVEELTFSGGCLGTLARTYNFTDGCGNTASAQQFITLEDSTPPVFTSVPNAVTASADALPEVATLSATDNSNEPVDITFHEFREKHQITRTWTAQDQCGNTAIASQVITLSGH
jgi:hypothetical protein